jgi:hypothetical protein
LCILTLNCCGRQDYHQPNKISLSEEAAGVGCKSHENEKFILVSIPKLHKDKTLLVDRPAKKLLFSSCRNNDFVGKKQYLLTLNGKFNTTMRTSAFMLILVTGIMLSLDCFSQSRPGEKFITAIEDNSMFLEEAYNQEDRVVQHISNLVFLPNLRDNFFFAFTQEWPAIGFKHQLSYTLQYSSFNRGAAAGFGDIMINYRYQLAYKQDFAAFSPRLSLIIPSGSKEKGTGSGSWGLQVNLPFSKRWTNQFVSHLNLGTTCLFSVNRDDINFSKSLISYFAGISSIWLVSTKFNLMLECLTSINADPGLNNSISYTSQTILAPAVRYAINIKKLQVVPGISLPITFSKSSNAQIGGFLYLSFEHEF